MQNRNSAAEPPAGAVSIRRFGDPDQLAADARHASMECQALAPSPPIDASMSRVELGEGAALQVAVMDFPHLTRGHVGGPTTTLSVSLRTDGGVTWNGHPVTEGTALLYREGSEIQARANGVDTLAVITLPQAEVDGAAAALEGAAPPRRMAENCRLLPAGSAPRQALESTVRRAARTLAERPEELASAEARQALLAELLHLAARITSGIAERAPDRERTVLSHAAVVAAAEEFMRSRLSLPLYVADLCGATGVSERTLRTAFRDVYGVGPNRLLKLRRLLQVRRTLQRGDRDLLVSAVATRNGFWDLGRFAGDYRALFGESPSRTLERSGGRTPAS